MTGGLFAWRSRRKRRTRRSKSCSGKPNFFGAGAVQHPQMSAEHHPFYSPEISMNSPPDPPVITPLPSEWNSAIIRNIAYAGLTLLATVIADFFGLSAENVLAKGGRFIDAAIAFGVVA